MLQPSKQVLEALRGFGLDYEVLPIQHIALDMGIDGPPTMSVNLVLWKPEHQEAIAKLLTALQEDRRNIEIHVEGLGKCGLIESSEEGQE